MLSDPARVYEIDPLRLKDPSTLAANTLHLSRLCKNILDSITASLDTIPPPFNILLYGVRRATAAHFADAQLSAVGGIVFLRFITPALVSPQQCGLCDSALPPAILRGLLLCSKVGQ